MSVNEFTRITFDLLAPVARVTLQNPPINVIDIPMMEEVSHAISLAEARPEVSVLVLTGSEKAFSAGVDVAAHTPDRVAEMLTKFHAIFRALVSSRRVLIAGVSGHCLGGGAELAMMCDVVITSETATWGFPEILLGCYPPVAVTALPSIVGQKRAAELILTGRKISGLEALSMGLASSVVAGAEVSGKVDAVVAQLTALSPASLAATKKAMYVWDAMHFDKGLARAEKIYLEELMQTEDAREGIEAFLEKREPKWTGK
ncbi:MAG TPA: enoyl-CoA hydratase/isomerase family protein [Terriglobales bacterium]|nr:enoyl-CoA hydratase/isomerase family protein [Terriglobales bacterium]